MKSLALISALVLTSLASAAHAGEWEHLGSRKVAFLGDHDTIEVTANEGIFNAIRLEVDKGDLVMWNVVVTFGNGEKFSPDTRWEFDKGTRSRVIDLPGTNRVIRKVEFAYKSRIRKGHAMLSLYGRHPTADAPPPVQPELRWDRLGTRQVKFHVERDTIPVTVHEGLFTAIKIEVQDGDLEMYDVVVTFGDGSTFSPGTRFVFDQGARSRVIDLPGAARIIKKVDFLYRSKITKGHADVVLYGRHPG